MLTIADYWMGRDATFPTAMTPEIEHNARITVELANKLLDRLLAAGVHVHSKPGSKSCISSGWRPPQVNAGTAGAAPNSKHMTGQAIDLYDPDGDIDDWLASEDGLKFCEQIGLWIEHPSATKGWAHVQTMPPRSGRRVFYP